MSPARWTFALTLLLALSAVSDARHRRLSLDVRISAATFIVFARVTKVEAVEVEEPARLDAEGPLDLAQASQLLAARVKALVDTEAKPLKTGGPMPQCPQCGRADEVVPIRYGFASAPPPGVEDDVHAGCCVEPEDRHCRCEHDFIAPKK